MMPIFLTIIVKFAELLNEDMVGMVLYYYEHEFTVRLLRCKCGNFGSCDWVYHGIHVKTVYVYKPDVGFDTVDICLKRFMCTRCGRTVTAFAWWIVRGQRHTLPTMLILLWEGQHSSEGQSVDTICALKGIGLGVYYRILSTYRKQLKGKVVPAAYRGKSLKELTEGYFSETPIEGMEKLAVKTLSGLVSFLADCESKIGYPLMQSKTHWRKEEIKPRTGHDHFFGAFPGSRYAEFYKGVGKVNYWEKLKASC